MVRIPQRSTRTHTLLPYPALVRSTASASPSCRRRAVSWPTRKRARPTWVAKCSAASSDDAGLGEELSMSRIGKNPVDVPAGVEIAIKGGLVSAKGKLGSLDFRGNRDVEISRDDGKLGRETCRERG